MILKFKSANLAGELFTPPAAPTRRLVRIASAAARLSCSVTTVRRRVKDGSLAYYRLHGRLMFDVRDLNALMDVHRIDPQNEGGDD